jgi:dTDP-4-amino-4,6-dideoxygalactose transaminase
MDELMKIIPSASPRASYLAHKAEIDAAITKVLESGWYIMGKEVEHFEREFASYVGVEECISVASGTDALILILRSLGIGPGDTVVTVSNTAVATVTAIDLVGARALLVDVDPVHLTMSPEHLERACTDWTGDPIKAIIPVHLYGQPADMDSIVAIARRVGAAIVEDCAQAHGAAYHGRLVGTIGDAAAFSFYPTKNLGALGDGGAVVTSDGSLAERCRLIKQYGWRQRYISEVNGMNTRLDEVQAAILRIKLKYLTDQNTRRREIARAYCQSGLNRHVVHPLAAAGTEHVFHQYVIQSDSRDSLQRHLQACGVASAILYPVPVHRQEGYTRRVSIGSGALQTTERVCHRILSLPIYPELTESATSAVRAAVMSFDPPKA